MKNTLYYGDNLDILREHIPDESVDLIYLDAPFRSNQDYNILFREGNARAREQSDLDVNGEVWTEKTTDYGKVLFDYFFLTEGVEEEFIGIDHVYPEEFEDIEEAIIFRLFWIWMVDDARRILERKSNTQVQDRHFWKVEGEKLVNDEERVEVEELKEAKWEV